MRRLAAPALALVATFGLAAGSRAQSGVTHDPKLWERALRVHRSAIVVDTHSDTTTRMLDEKFDVGEQAKDGHMDLPRVKEGGLDAQFFSIYVDKKYVKEGGSARRALDMIDALYRQVAIHSDRMEMAYTVDDVRRITKQGKLAALMGIEGGHAIENSLGALRMFYRLGVRYMTLTHTNTNDWADSAGTIDDDPATLQRWHGLNDLGREVVGEMNRLGMLVDISHVSDETFWDVMEVTKAPVIASHSGARALANHPRNLTDDELRAVAKNNGVVMVVFYDTFLDQRRIDETLRLRPERRAVADKYKDDPAAQEKALDAFDAAHALPVTPLKVLIDHIDHVAKVAGVDHVGLGSDFDGGITTPQGLRDVRDLPEITYALLERGYSDEDVRKILGGNILRVLGDAERVARELQRK
jgi:membrane dipeptidase